MRLSSPLVFQCRFRIRTLSFASAQVLIFTSWVFFLQNRWLLIEFIPYSEKDKTPLSISQATQPGAEVNGKKVWDALRDSVQANFGDVGWGSVAGSLTGSCCIFCRHEDEISN